MNAGSASSEPTDVIVVGGGVIGLATALELLDKGRSVRLLERRKIGAAASHGNAGLITPSHATPLTQPGMVRQVLRWMIEPSSPIYVRPMRALTMLGFGWRFARACRRDAMLHTLHARALLLQSSRELFAELIERESLECEWETAGLLLAFSTSEAFDAETGAHAFLAEHDIQAEALSPSELVEREPALRDDLAGGSFYPGDAHLRPDWLMREMLRLVRERGGLVEEDIAVGGVRAETGRVSALETTRGVRAATDFVLATGAWAPELGARLGLDLVMEPGKGYSLTFTRPGRSPRLPLILEEAATGATPWPSGLRLSGTVEFSGFDETSRSDRFDAMRRGAERYLHTDLTGEAVESWTGMRPMTPDELPIIGRSPRYGNAYVATGHGRMGVSMAPSTGRLVAELLVGSEPHVDPDPFSPARFA